MCPEISFGQQTDETIDLKGLYPSIHQRPKPLMSLPRSEDTAICSAASLLINPNWSLSDFRESIKTAYRYNFTLLHTFPFTFFFSGGRTFISSKKGGPLFKQLCWLWSDKKHDRTELQHACCLEWWGTWTKGSRSFVLKVEWIFETSGRHLDSLETCSRTDSSSSLWAERALQQRMLFGGTSSTVKSTAIDLRENNDWKAHLRHEVFVE